MSNALIPVEQQDMEVYSQYEGQGYDSFGEQEFLKPPVLAVSQPTSEHSPEGQFFLSQTGEDLGDRVKVVLLHIQRTMAYRPGGVYDSPAVCWSRNFWFPSEGVPDQQANQCHKKTRQKPLPVCPLAQWVGAGENRQAPQCEETWIMAVALVDEQMILDRESCALLYLRRMNLPGARDFMGQMRTLYKRLPLFGFAIDLELSYKTKKDGYKGNFYTITFPDLRDPADKERIHLLPVEQLAEMAEAQTFFKDYLEGEVSVLEEEQVASEDEDKEENSESVSVAGQQSLGATSPNGANWGAK